MSVALSLRPLGEALGTEVVGVDVSRPFEAATLEWIDRAFAEHPVMVFRNQRLGPAELAAFGSQFGRPQPHILEQYRHPDRTDVSYITNVDKAGGIDRFGVTRASTWHTDETYEDALPLLSRLARGRRRHVGRDRDHASRRRRRAARGTPDHAADHRSSLLTEERFPAH